MAVFQNLKILYKIRDLLWEYPIRVFGEGGVLFSFLAFYKSLRPFSHISVFVVLFSFFGFLDFSQGTEIFQGQNDVMIEGVVVGEGGLSRVNPIMPTNNQLEVDLAKLIYLSLVRVDGSANVLPVLAKNWERVDKEGKEYKFYLEDDVYWHDGEKFTSDDVIATFEVLKALGAEKEGGIKSKQTELAQNVEVIKHDEYSLSFKLDQISPTFFEDLNFGILPGHVLDKVSLSLFSRASFNLNPVGTGPFVFYSYKDDIIRLSANPNYYGKSPKIKELRFHLYKTGDDAVDALKSGQIHMLTDPSTAVLKNLENVLNIETLKSTNLYRRYWALYFNLREGQGTQFSDQVLRQVVSSVINREEILAEVETAGVEAKGPIPENSWAYNAKAKRFDYNPKKARKLLDDAGWKKKEVGGKFVRMNEKDEVLRMELSYLDKYDRELVVERIKTDLEKLGIVVNLDPRSSSDLNEALIATRNFDTVLYGVETPIDPDRVRLWHSDAINYPGLNISSYKSTQERAVIGDDGELERISVTDAALANGLSTLIRSERKGGESENVGYLKFQEILFAECPAVFLYHPVFTYAIHNRVKGVDLSEMTAPEERYLSILEWHIE